MASEPISFQGLLNSNISCRSSNGGNHHGTLISQGTVEEDLVGGLCGGITAVGGHVEQAHVPEGTRALRAAGVGAPQLPLGKYLAFPSWEVPGLPSGAQGHSLPAFRTATSPVG